MSSNRRRSTSKRKQRKGVLQGFRRPTGVGAMPGSIDTSIPAGQARLAQLKYGRHDVVEERLTDYHQVLPPREPDQVTWLQICGTPDSGTLTHLAQTFNLHLLALEDVTNTHQRCKMEDYHDHLFVIVRLPRYAEQNTLITEQVSLFIGHNFVVSFHDGDGAEEIFRTVRDRIIRSHARVREMPADYLGYAILDIVTDHYFPVIEEIGNRLNAVDAQIEEGVSHEQRSEIRELRADLLLLRRTVWPQRDALAALMRDDCQLISPATKTYLRDCYDHTVQIIDVTETYRELCADLRDFHLAEISFRSNEVMKTLTIIATLFMPLSFVAGFYGMNFQYMPELSWRYSYPMLIGFMLLIAGSLLYWFRRRGWIK